MKENYFIIHGSFSSPYSNWFGWLHQELSQQGKEVYVPSFPIGVEYQNYTNWSKLLDFYYSLGLINENTTIIAHSIGPVFISKYLILNKVKVKKLIFVAGFNNYLGINKDYDQVNHSMYLDNIEDIHQYCSNIICLYSNNDPYVRLEEESKFAASVATSSKIITNAGHLNSESGYDKFNELFEYIN